MNAIETLKLLTAQMHLEPAEDTGCPQIGARLKDDLYIGHAVLPNGQQIKLLKTLLTSACERNCYYCPFRVGRDFRRASFQPDEMAQAFMTLHRAGAVEGIFLSSGIAHGGITTQDKLIATAELLRRKHAFQGYIHLKIMPGAERDQVWKAMLLADRVSINLEAPNTHRLNLLAPRKQFVDELIQPLRWIDEIRYNQPGQRAWKGYWPSSTTQFVVGAVGESDLELLTTTQHLYRDMHLRRAYYSAFSPIEDTPLENQPSTPLQRQNRLYQASFLLRDYGFDLEELPFEQSGFLPLETDPKLAWAKLHLAGEPVDLNNASREELLRVPGIGIKGVQIILAQRGIQPIRDLSSLTKLGVNPKRAAPFILLNGKRPAYQTYFW